MEATHIIKPDFYNQNQSLFVNNNEGVFSVRTICEWHHYEISGPASFSEQGAVSKWNAMFSSAPKGFDYE